MALSSGFRGGDAKVQEHAAATTTSSLPPPPYTPDVPSRPYHDEEERQRQQNKEEEAPEYSRPDFHSLVDDKAMSLAPATNKFPPSFAVYTPPMRFSGPFYLGTPDDKKQFAFSVKWGYFTCKNPITIHDGSSNKDPILGQASGMTPNRSCDCTITVPRHNHNLNAGPADSSAAADLVVRAGYVHESWRKSAFTFTMPVPAAASASGGAVSHSDPPQHETFQWRNSHGGEIREVERFNFLCGGWKLVRTTGPETRAGGARKEREAGFASDGCEVVAVMANSSNCISSMTKPIKFAFMGSGLTGVLGQEWEVVAVTTALQLWWAQVQTSVVTAAVA